jgi:hypothetical protein
VKKAVLALLAVAVLSTGLDARSVRVKGYFRKNGTYVAPHYRSAPNSSKLDNWSTGGNVNPYTGRTGTASPRMGGAGKSNAWDWVRSPAPSGHSANAWDWVNSAPPAPAIVSAPAASSGGSELPSSFHGTFITDVSKCSDPEHLEKVVLSAKQMRWYETVSYIQSVQPEPSPPNTFRVHSISKGEGQMWESVGTVRLSPDGQFVLLGEINQETGARPQSKDLVIMQRCPH